MNSVVDPQVQGQEEQQVPQQQRQDNNETISKIFAQSSLFDYSQSGRNWTVPEEFVSFLFSERIKAFTIITQATSKILTD
jgi:hypothetical protein